MNPRLAVPGLVLVALAAGCSSGSSGGGEPPPTVAPTTATPTPTPSTASPTPSPTPTHTVTVTASPSSSPPVVTACRSSHLTLSLGSSQGAAGTSYQVIVLTNHGSVACTMYGYPGVSYLNASGAILGKPASRDPGTVATITVKPGKAASTVLRQPNPRNFPPSTCKITTANRLQVYPPGETHSLTVAVNTQVCTTSTGRAGIGPMVAGTSGS